MKLKTKQVRKPRTRYVRGWASYSASVDKDVLRDYKSSLEERDARGRELRLGFLSFLKALLLALAALIILSLS